MDYNAEGCAYTPWSVDTFDLGSVTIGSIPIPPPTTLVSFAKYAISTENIDITIENHCDEGTDGKGNDDPHFFGFWGQKCIFHRENCSYFFR